MFDSDVITMHYTKERRIYVPTDAVLFKPKGRLSIIQKWLWAQLEKMGVLEPYEKPTVKVERIAFSSTDFSNRLIEAYGKCFPYDKPKHVYIGPEEFDRLVGSKNHVIVSLDFTVRMGYNKQIFGLPVTVVPHMKGCLIV